MTAEPTTAAEGAPWLDRLHPYQVTGTLRLLSGNAALLADDMGLGKTIQAIAALRGLAAAAALGKALLVVPAPLVTQWRAQLYEWAPELRFSTVRGPRQDRAWQWRAPAPIFIVSYETLRSDFSTNPHSPVGREWDVVLLDEAQRIKNRESETARVCKGLRRRRAWALTGTPLENRLDDLASILEFTQPNTATERPRPFHAGPGLLERHGEVQLRRRKDDVLKDLPPKTIIEVPIELSPDQRKSYDRAEREGIVELRALGERLTITHVLELILRLKQICNFCPETGQSAKLDDMTERLESIAAAGHRALVFSQFVSEPFGLKHVERRLAPLRPLIYHGGMDMTERDIIIQRFKRDESRKALLVSLRAGGQGLNLQEASYVFHFDRWWNPAVEHQAEDRVHRLGQQSPVFVYAYVTAGTIEERIATILRGKEALFEAVIDRRIPRGLTAADLFGLFGLTLPPSLRPA